jgi:hypothetical protein
MVDKLGYDTLNRQDRLGPFGLKDPMVAIPP